MASELRVDTLKDSSGNNSVGMAYVAEGSAKSWSYIDGGGTPTLEDSLNVSSVTDIATGQVASNFTNNMSNANFSSTFTPREQGFIALMQELDSSNQRSTSRCTSLCHNNATTVHADCDGRSFAIHGDLA